MKVVAVDHVFADLELERRVLSSVDVVDARGLERDDVLAVCADADGILVGARFAFDAPAIARLQRCRVIARYGIGVERIDAVAAAAAGIQVAYVPDYCVEEVAEHALALVLALVRRIPELDRRVRDGVWGVPPGMPIRRLSATTLGVLGFGRIGEAVGRRAVALGMRVLAYDPARNPEDVRAAGAVPSTLDELLAEADLVTLHAPPADEPLLGARELAQLKPGAALVNVGRASLVDEPALVAALREGRLSGAGIDVPAREPLTPPDPLLELPSVLVTPHSAWYSLDAVVELRTKAAEEVARVLRGEPPLHAVPAR